VVDMCPSGAVLPVLSRVLGQSIALPSEVGTCGLRCRRMGRSLGAGLSGDCVLEVGLVPAGLGRASGTPEGLNSDPRIQASVRGQR